VLLKIGPKQSSTVLFFISCHNSIPRQVPFDSKNPFYSMQYQNCHKIYFKYEWQERSKEEKNTNRGLSNVNPSGFLILSELSLGFQKLRPFAFAFLSSLSGNMPLNILLLFYNKRDKKWW
jgi:hypothetical protein